MFQLIDLLDNACHTPKVSTKSSETPIHRYNKIMIIP